VGADCAGIRIRHFRRAGLSADDRRIAVLNTAFEPVLVSFGLFRAIRSVVRRIARLLTQENRIVLLAES
jgi:hypothetical protein